MRKESGVDKYLVQVDRELEELIPEYLGNRKKEIPLFRDALGRNDFDAISHLAHKVKGSGGGYGFPRVSELGGEIEKASRAQEASATQKVIADLEHYLDHLEVVYK